MVRRVVGKEYADGVQDLDNGEAFLMADFFEADIHHVQIRRKRTFDAGATPDLEDFDRPNLKSVSGDLVSELEEISDREEQRQDRIAQLEVCLEELQAEKVELEDELESARDMQNLAQQMAEGLRASGGNGDVASETVDELVEERTRLRSVLEDREGRINELETEVGDLQHELEQRPDIGERAMEAVEVLADEFGVADGGNQTLRRKLKIARERIEKLESGPPRDQEELDFDPMANRDVKRLVSEVESRLDDFNETRLKISGTTFSTVLQRFLKRTSILAIRRRAAGRTTLIGNSSTPDSSATPATARTTTLSKNTRERRSASTSLTRRSR